jgi:toxin FitB
MPTVAEPPLLLDTSVAVPWLVEDHNSHVVVVEALHGHGLGLAGYAAFETFSVLTRLPGDQRVSPAVAAALLARGFPETRHLSSERSTALLDSFGRLRVSGGSVYDALVAAAAVEHGLTLVSRDARALATYDAVGAEVRYLDG